MPPFDFYVQHLLRHKATLLELSSGQPVRFGFPSGDRRSNTKVEHNQIVQLIQQAAPPDAFEELRRAGTTRFRHAGGETQVDVVVQAKGPGAWQVIVKPAEQVHRTAEVDPTPRIPTNGASTAADRPPDSNKTNEASALVEAPPGEPLIHKYLRGMVAMGASDLHLSSEVCPMVRLHGEMKPLEQRVLSHQDLSSMLDAITPERNREEFRGANDTDFAHMIEGVARFRANVFMDRKGIGAVFRQIPFEILSPEQLGLPQQVLDLCWLSKGLVLVTGPTGSGKSTTLATLIDYINRNRSDHIITIEDPIEFVHENQKCLVNQREIGQHTRSFKNALRAALREDPDIVLVGEMRDLETISIAVETAETGHLVFGTLHTTTAPSTVDRIIDQFPPDQQAQIRVMLSESLRGVIAQVLCKKKSGGRAAAYEILISNPAVANLIREGKTFQLTSVMQTGKALGMQTMNEHLLKLVKTGAVDAREAYVKASDKLQIKDLFARNNIPLDLT